MKPNEPTRLHLDADTSQRKLFYTLRMKGFDITRTPNEWIALAASDIEQLQGATQKQRVIFTFNISDFSRLAKQVPDHSGILLAHQRRWNLSTLLSALERMFAETQATDWQGQVRWLADWRSYLDS